MRIRKQISVTIDPDLLRKVDELRGYIPRSVFLEILLKKAVEEQAAGVPRLPGDPEPQAGGLARDECKQGRI